MLCCMCEGQRTTFRTWFSPSTTWVPLRQEFKLRSSDLVAGIFTPLDPGGTSLRGMAKVLTEPNSNCIMRANYKETEQQCVLRNKSPHMCKGSRAPGQ